MVDLPQMEELTDLEDGLKIIWKIKRRHLTDNIRYLRCNLCIGRKESLVSGLLVCTEDVETVVYGRYIGNVEIYVFHLILQDDPLKIT